MGESAISGSTVNLLSGYTHKTVTSLKKSELFFSLFCVRLSACYIL